jgi:TPP-dependent pyruvate/acetoin dehydrogenase alpha subunit
MTAPAETIPAELVLDLYRTISRIRACELRIREQVETEGFGGFWHPGIGQEGLQAGAVANLRPDDYLFYAHRGLGYVVAKGMSLDKIFGDLFGRTTGSTGGKGAGTVHFVDRELGILGQGGTLGSNFVLAVGVGVSIQLLKQDRVCMVFFGDGASARGTFYEAGIEAAVWKLPIVFVCENNGWAVSASFRDHSPTEHVSDRAAAFAIPAQVVDGQDALAVYGAVHEAVRRARSGEGPSLVEAMTLRIRGHYEGDRQRYRDEAAPDDEFRSRDPLEVLRARLDGVDTGAIDEEERRAVHEAFDRALAAPRPDPSIVYRDLWIE